MRKKQGKVIEKSLDKASRSVYIQSVLILIIHLIQSIQFWIDEKDKKKGEGGKIEK
jgi:hypothetical protein